MGAFLADRAAPTDDLVATPFTKEEFHPEVQKHDRLPAIIDSSGAADFPMAGTPDEDMVEVEITATQKMLSAMSGSLLTSLLGMLFYLSLTCKAC